jgi:hypothetical protein
VRYFEFVDEAPFVYLLAEHRTNVSTKGADMLPKRALQHMKCEVARILKLTGDSVEPLSFVVPRKVRRACHVLLLLSRPACCQFLPIFPVCVPL